MPEPINPLLHRVRESVADSYDLLGELGPDEQGIELYLARDLATGALEGLSVQQDDEQGNEFTIEVRRTLGETVHVRGNTCPECQTPLPDLERFCFNCGADLSGLIGMDGSSEVTRVLHALAAATVGRYEILGRMLREGTDGAVYFARELDSQRIVALRLRRVEPADHVAAEYVVRQTPVFGPPVARPDKVVKLAEAAPVVAAGVSGVARSASRPITIPDAPSADGSAPNGLSANGASPASRSWKRRPVFGAVAVLVIATAGYFALRSDDVGSAGAPVIRTADTAAAPAAAPPSPADSIATTTTRSVAPGRGTSADSGTVELFALPPDARVTIDGRTVRARTLPLRAGSHTLAITANGFERLTQKFTVTAGRGLRLAPVLVASAAKTPAPSGDAGESRPAPRPSCRTATRDARWTAALELCTADANAGDVVAMANLARQYARGLGVATNGEQGYAWYAKAAQAGDAESQTFIAYALREGQHVKRDEQESARWFKAAAEAGNATAQFEYGVALERGKGVKKDEAAAREWYKKGAEAGKGEAAFRLARLYERGDGGPRSNEQAAVAYERGATLGHGQAALTIAKWYREGRGVAKSPEKSLQWFRKAADLGNEDAKREVAKLEKGTL